jgi:GDP/UDP-N,N'-diacetylbacillosamine 2-epimerase (hydrolysing)
MKRVCVVTGTRAEYGLLRWVMQGIRESASLELQLLVTGMHLSPEFGLTFRDIEADGFRIDRKIEMLLSSDTPVGIGKSMGLAICGFADALAELRPDLLLVLGDRYEILSAVSAAMVAGIPIAHISGGESTEGVIDDSIRHAVTKMSHLHFVAAEAYRRRVVQLGESPDRVFLVGGLGVDTIRNLPLLTREELEHALDFQLGQRNLLVTFHPETLERNSSERQMAELFAALEELHETHLIFTMPNADTGGRILFEMIKKFVSRHSATCRAYTSLGQLRYLSCMRHVDGVVGNSSSGLAEAPSFKTGTINIGDRQLGRLKAASVIDCESNRVAIGVALKQLFSPEFRAGLHEVVNPYGSGGASEAVVRTLEQISLDGLVKKHFFDIAAY